MWVTTTAVDKHVHQWKRTRNCAAPGGKMEAVAADGNGMKTDVRIWKT